MESQTYLGFRFVVLINENKGAFDTAYDEEYPMLSISKVVKRRSRIDLGNQHVKKSDNEGRDAGLLQEAVSSTSQQDDNSLPTKFGKKYVRRDNRMPKYLRGEGSSDRTERRPVIDPFDICLPNSSKSSVQKTMSLENNMEQDSEIEFPIIETRQILRPGMILLTNYISLGEQVEIINKCRELGVDPGGFYQPGYQDGTKLRLRMMCLGKKWDPETKYEEQIRSDDSEPVGIPAEFVLLVERALSDSHTLIKKHRAASKVEEILPGMIPDICIVNFYTTNGKLGLHQDRDESRESLSRGLPVVSFSVGDSAEFLYGDQRNVNKAERILLRSGDVLIFGGNSRHIFHGVTSIVPNSAPPALLKEAKLRPGRLNLTFRQY